MQTIYDVICAGDLSQLTAHQDLSTACGNGDLRLFVPYFSRLFVHRSQSADPAAATSQLYALTHSLAEVYSHIAVHSHLKR